MKEVEVVIMEIGWKFDNMIDITFSVVMRQNKKELYNLITDDNFLQSLSLSSGFLPPLFWGKENIYRLFQGYSNT